ncbi:MAG: histidinol-phosphate transaminase [Bacteroidetes bacterium]|nr:histidinol-phosphate transaminase [Bacteroidota bacterium]
MIQNLVRKNIVNLQPYSSAREDFTGSEGVFLDANENPFGTYNRYPDPYQKQLKEKLAQIKGCQASQIFIGNGSDEVIDLAFRIFCNPKKDKALIFTPTYGMYEVSANINEVELIKVPLTVDFQLDMMALKPHLSDESIKVLFLCSPNNPTGNSIPITEIEYILKNFKGVVVLDEAYIDFSQQDSFLSRLDEFQNLIISQTLSKAWGLAGLRLGLAFMNAEILHFYNKVKAPYNVSTINQETALQALCNYSDFKYKVALIIEERTKLIQLLETVPIILKIYPTDANFILIKVHDANELYQKLVREQVIVRNRNSVIKNTLRITVGTKEENEKLIKFFNHYSK